MKKRIIILFTILMMLVVFFVSGASCLSIWPERSFTKEELQTGLINIELVHWKETAESSVVTCKVIYTLNEEEQQYVIEKIASTNITGAQPLYTGEPYAIRFLYEDRCLLFERYYVSEKQLSGAMLEGTKGIWTREGVLGELIDEFVEIALLRYTS